MTVDQLVAEVEKLSPDEKAEFLDKVTPVPEIPMPIEVPLYPMTSPIFAPLN